MIGHRKRKKRFTSMGSSMKKAPCCYLRALITLEFMICKVMMRNGVLRNNLKKEGRKVGNGAWLYFLAASG